MGGEHLDVSAHAIRYAFAARGFAGLGLLRPVLVRLDLVRRAAAVELDAVVLEEALVQGAWALTARGRTPGRGPLRRMLHRFWFPRHVLVWVRARGAPEDAWFAQAAAIAEEAGVRVVELDAAAAISESVASVRAVMGAPRVVAYSVPTR